MDANPIKDRFRAVGGEAVFWFPIFALPCFLGLLMIPVVGLMILICAVVAAVPALIQGLIVFVFWPEDKPTKSVTLLLFLSSVLSLPASAQTNIVNSTSNSPSYRTLLLEREWQLVFFGDGVFAAPDLDRHLCPERAVG
jgi:hypothetical protein